FLLSRTFVPMLCAQWLGDHTHAGEEHVSHGWGARIHRPIGRALTFTTRQYGRLLAVALRHRALVLATVALLFLGSLALAFGIGREFFPQVDAGQITMHVRAPSNSRLDTTDRRIVEVERFLEDNIPLKDRDPKDGGMIVSEIGLDPDWSSAYSDNSGQQDAVIRIQLAEHRGKTTAQEYAVQLRHAFNNDPRFADLRVDFNTGGMVSTALNYGASSPIDVQVAGIKDADQAMKLANEIRNQVRDVRGAADVRLAQRLDAPYLIIDVNRKKAASAGLSAEDVILQVVAAMNSSVSINRNFWIDTKTGNQYFVAVQYPENPDMNLENLLNVVATGTNQSNPVKLGSLIDIHPRSDAVEINHVSLYRTLDILINTENRDIGTVAGKLQKKLRDLQRQLWAREAAKESGQLAMRTAKDGAV